MTVAPDVVPPLSSGEATALLRWWRRYCDPTYPAHRPAIPAQLRRARSSVEAMSIPAAVDLARGGGWRDDQAFASRLDLARVLAHVKVNDPLHVMARAGYEHFPSADEARPRILSEQRFHRLLLVDGGEERVSAFVRLIHMLGGKANVEVLGRGFLDWTHPDRRDEVRRQWAYEYFAVKRGPQQNDPTPEITE